MNYTLNKTNYKEVIILLFFILISIPKINLISVEGESAGLRVDDIIIFASAFVLFYKNKLIPMNIDRAFLIYYAFVFIALFSYLINRSFSDAPSLFYVVRNVEYFMFFVAGTLLGKPSRLIQFLVTYFVIQVVIVILQYFLLFPAFSSTDGMIFGYLSGTTGGPWELSTTLSLTAIVILDYLLLNKKYSKAFFMFLFTNLIFLFLGQRSPIVALFLVFVFSIYLRVGIYKYLKSVKGMLIFITVPIFYYFFLIYQSQGFIFEKNDAMGRFALIISSKGGITTFIDYYNYIDVDSFRVPIGSWANLEHLDLSWVQRIEKWSYAIKTFVSMMPKSIFIGIGPGWSGPSLDSGMLRLFIEHGIIGTILFFAFLNEVFKKNRNAIFIILVLLLNMVFIDVNISYKVMALFLLIAGVFFRNEDFMNS
jgi:hypothetical protein